MSFKDYIRKFKKNYVVNKIKNTKISTFDSSPTKRKRIVFSGKVQKVGFRLEIYELAQKLVLSGWVKNRNDGKVELEVQGENNKISFLTNNMKNLKRAKVVNIKIDEIPLIDGEVDFVIIKEY